MSFSKTVIVIAISQTDKHTERSPVFLMFEHFYNQFNKCQILKKKIWLLINKANKCVIWCNGGK